MIGVYSEKDIQKSMLLIIAVELLKSIQHHCVMLLDNLIKRMELL